MNLGCIVLKIKFYLFFLCLPVFTYSQNQYSEANFFYSHLKRNNLINEQLIFNKLLKKEHSEDPIFIDSLQLELAKIYKKVNSLDSCTQTLLRINNFNHFTENNYRLYLSMLIVSNRFDIARNTIQQRTLPEGKFHNDIELSIKILQRISFTETILNDTIVSNSILEIKDRYQKAPNYSPLLSGIYSSIVPGLGKMYIGYTLQGVTALVANLLLGAQVIESYIKTDVNHPRFIISASVFGIFYFGNIWGSVVMTKKRKYDYFKQLDYEIQDHYNSIINNNNY